MMRRMVTCAAAHALSKGFWNQGSGALSAPGSRTLGNIPERPWPGKIPQTLDDLFGGACHASSPLARQPAHPVDGVVLHVVGVGRVPELGDGGRQRALRADGAHAPDVKVHLGRDAACASARGTS